MQQEQIFTAVLNRAAQMGALQPIEEQAVDLGIKITAKAVLFDSIRTIIGFEITEEAITGYIPSAASLVDYENNISYSLLAVRRIESNQPFPWFLEFEPVSDLTRSVLLTIEEMQVTEEGKMPLLKINTLYDPWEPDPEISEEIFAKLEAWRAELIPEKEGIPPVWECTGQWRFNLYPNLEYRKYYSKSYPCYITMPILDQAMKISRIDSGISGSLLYCDSYPKNMNAQEIEVWKNQFMRNILAAKNPMDFAARMQTDEIGLFRPMYFKITLTNTEHGYVYPTSGSGPWGIFNTRLYYISDTVDDPKKLELKIEEIFNITPKESIKIPLEIRDIDENQEQSFSITSPFLAVEAVFSVKEMHYDAEYLIINHDISIFTGNINYIRIREVKLIDKYGDPYNPIDKSSHWSEKHGIMLRGFTFPPVHYKGGEAVLEIKSIDVAPIVPFKFNVTV